jgi:6-phosphogluconolactonase
MNDFKLGGKLPSRKLGHAPLAFRCFFAFVVFATPFWFTEMAAHPQAAPDSYFLYVGTYTSSISKGIYLFRYKAETAQLDSLGLVAELANPSFAVADAAHRYLYVATEMANQGDAHRGGWLNSFSIDSKTGALKFLNKVDSGGDGTCHLTLDRTGRILLAANFSTGSVVSFAVNRDGSIGERTGFDQHSGSGINFARQQGSHFHEVVLSPDNRFLFAPDLGMDRIYLYDVDATRRSFSPHHPEFITVNAGLGPRHLLFGPGGKFAYLICEMGSSVVVFSYSVADGGMKEIQRISTLPDDFKGEDASAEIQIDRSGRYIYASNRGDNSITEFAIDPSKGTLTKIEVMPTGGKWPRNFVLDPTGKHLLVANQYTNDLSLFAIHPSDGRLTHIEQIPGIAAPVSLLFVPAK